MILTRNNLDKIIAVGDKVLIKTLQDPTKTSSGLYLPPTVTEKEKVQTGYVVKVGPGYPLPSYEHDDEPWKEKKNPVKYLSLQAKVGDIAVFLKKDAVEIEFDSEKFLIINHSSILLLYREDIISALNTSISDENL
ncbi:MAG TPA: co-chaperone GroES family protein [Ignavibacteriales bacterium]|nr:co-chaperone GroES family protein [Ignavibacteriales bacterium]HOL80988.1 co-chaperone GroES family protein [Ignavibacteriales bacterium]HOM64724.1 co-chaperone GroES family protein [Ignavibacteriales bacterium]HPD66744.1 co-chaperone GroES family protein [Ignavibacteriales bacterium]HPP32768.1 co-chaperone GroES family protein [Ignavibacteriales bacterium]